MSSAFPINRNHNHNKGKDDRNSGHRLQRILRQLQPQPTAGQQDTTRTAGDDGGSRLQKRPELRFQVRDLQKTDFDRGFLNLISQLTHVGVLGRKGFEERLELMMKDGNYRIRVLLDLDADKIIGSATLVMELKFAHGAGKCGHVEDVVVDKTYRGYGIGKILMDDLLELARDEYRCYKVTLNCSDHNAPFYEKCGFVRKDIQMTLYYDENDVPPAAGEKRKIRYNPRDQKAAGAKVFTSDPMAAAPPSSFPAAAEASVDMVRTTASTGFQYPQNGIRNPEADLEFKEVEMEERYPSQQQQQQQQQQQNKQPMNPLQGPVVGFHGVLRRGRSAEALSRSRRKRSGEFAEKPL